MSEALWLAEYAWLPEQDAPTPDVLIETTDGRITAVTPLTPSGRPDAGVDVLGDAVRLPGLTLPGLANVHSHAFHRALRGRTHGGRGDFWSWRDQMYAVTSRLDPDSYLALARAVYAEMALAGITAVGEFHYLHHGPDGTPYNDPNAMSAALVEAAAQAGIRLTLLDTCYLTASVGGEPLAGPQRRFGDGDASRWAERVGGFTPDGAHARLGAAIHSVRAVPADQLATVAGWAHQRDAPLHVHLSEQPAENDACRAVHGRTPTALLAEHGVLGRSTTAVHATHPTGGDVSLLGESRTAVCLCPTTERDLADGIGPARRMADAGIPLSLGSDSHAVIDLFEEARAVELDERLRTRKRGHFTPAELLTAASAAGHAALGWTDAGRIAVGARADLVTVALDSVRTAGVAPAGVWFAASAADVSQVVVDGRVLVRDGHHLTVDVPHELATSIATVIS
ncbi:formimidoylglutamate deiminase [Micromonospora endophytica]|uniref:Formimidoylglutamate deiminase n=1 Tax=Micromonospora endophytica TaxID=515350 RepID=A0A2W2CI27_9ACTN|nr:formimidoylglutamate deiminase [Micromonospora endophytica]PZF99081.1 formimidoylglutamate deiminase [Micromonospora endophytica]RIW41939.1 formimidoylglutamate deiminase [Micromonospora endophytica]BCJ58258.1 formimidoylglutamate deiminase [Micromonospora endophytica]